MNNLLLALAGALILALAALFVGPYFIDWNSYRTVFEEQATRLAGRPVSVEGNVNLRLLPAPYVSFERVKIADDSEAGSAPLLTIENYTLWLAVPPLLQGEIEAQAMEIDRPSLRLAVKADGSVNWSGLGQGDVDLPFVPRNVAFRDTNITGGKIDIHGANGDALVSIDNISGTFTALALTGPFKFTGEIGQDDDVHTVRWSTGRFEEGGGLRIKGALKNKTAGTTYAADGLLQKMMTRPVFTGGIAGKLRKKGRVGFEMKTDVYADTSGAQFKDITLLLDAEGRPQIVNGEGQALWQDTTGATAKIDLTSRWLDIDRLIVTDVSEQHLLARLDAMQSFLVNSLPDGLATTATFKASQVNFGGEALDDVALKVSRRGKVTHLETLSANLPGAANLSLTGRLAQSEISTPETAPAFKGVLSVRGRTLSRFASWLKPDWGAATSQIDGAFALDTKVVSSSDVVQFEDARARVGETRFTGTMRHGRETRIPLKLTLDTPALDVTRFFPDAEALGSAVRKLMATKEPDGTTSPQGDAAAIVQINIGTLQAGETTLADVAISARSVAGKVDVKRAAFISAKGLELDATANARQVEGDGSTPPVRFVLRLHNRAAYDEFVQLTGVAAPDTAMEKASRSLLPAHIAGSLERDAAAGSVNLRYDGSLAGNPALGRIRIDGTAEDWGERTWTVTTDVSLDKPAALFKEFGLPAQATIATSGSSEASGKAAGEPGRMVLYAIGLPNKGLKTDFSLQAHALNVNFSGAVESVDGGLKLDGTVQGRIRDNADIARLLAVDATRETEISFSADLLREANKTVLKDIRVMAGETVLTGTSQLSSIEGVTHVDITAETSHLALPALFAVALPSRGKAVAKADTDVVWPETPFDFSALNKLSVTSSIKAATLLVGNGVTVAEAALVLSGTAQEIALKSLTAKSGDGSVTATAALERRPAGAQVIVNVRGAKIPLNLLAGLSDGNTSNPANRPDGAVSFEVSLKGIGLSPRGVVSVMQGEGRIDTDAGSIEYFSPQVVQDVAADIADENAAVSPDDLKARIAERLTDRRLELGAQSISFRIRDGAIQADVVRVDTPAATISATSFVDIARLRLDSEWRISPKSVSGSSALPPVTVFYAGDVRNIAALKPGFGVAALERELTVRRLEGNIDQLEGLQSLKIKKRKSPDDEAETSSARGTLRPTIGGDVEDEARVTDDNEEQAATRPSPPRPARPKRRKRSTSDSLWQLEGEQPPVDLRLQTPENANPT